MSVAEPKSQCPCCDYFAIDGRGCFDICPICNWEDDGLDPENPDHLEGGDGGPNGMTLREGRNVWGNYRALKGPGADAAQFEYRPRTIPGMTPSTGPTLIAILEDDDRRLAEMRSTLAERFPWAEVVTYADAHEFIGWLSANISRVSVLCLDHDLVPPERRPGEAKPRDPGDGRDVVEWLLAQAVKVPVIIHTSNPRCGEQMETSLKEAGWSVSWSVPFEDLTWIRQRWLGRVMGVVSPPAS